MKKFLLTAALVLALVTSLTAGTMAYYSATVSEISNTLTTKYFSFTADQTAKSFDQSLTIAPGDKVEYYVTVNNASEVRTDAIVDAKLSNEFKGMTVKVVNAEGSKDNELTSDGTAGATESTAKTLMGTESYQTYLITVDWDYMSGDVDDSLIGANQTTKLLINISGQQHNDGTTYKANVKAD